jgi:hypothetical protein
VTGHLLGPGDYYCAAPGTVHEDTYTEAGASFFSLPRPSRGLPDQSRSRVLTHPEPARPVPRPDDVAPTVSVVRGHPP